MITFKTERDMQKVYDVDVYVSVIIPVKGIVANYQTEAENIALEKAKFMNFRTDAEFNEIQEAITTNDIEIIPIMNTTNGHDEDLVDKINIAHFRKQIDFMNIVKLLMERDKTECTEKEVNDVYEYLMHVADDQDLKTILSFLRL